MEHLLVFLHRIRGAIDRLECSIHPLRLLARHRLHRRKKNHIIRLEVHGGLYRRHVNDRGRALEFLPDGIRNCQALYHKQEGFNHIRHIRQDHRPIVIVFHVKLGVIRERQKCAKGQGGARDEDFPFERGS